MLSHCTEEHTETHLRSLLGLCPLTPRLLLLLPASLFLGLLIVQWLGRDVRTECERVGFSCSRPGREI